MFLAAAVGSRGSASLVQIPQTLSVLLLNIYSYSFFCCLPALRTICRGFNWWGFGVLFRFCFFDFQRFHWRVGQWCALCCHAWSRSQDLNHIHFPNRFYIEETLLSHSTTLMLFKMSKIVRKDYVALLKFSFWDFIIILAQW